MARLAVDDGYILTELLYIKKLAVPLVSPLVAALTTASTAAGVALDFDKGTFAQHDWVLVGAGLNQSAYQLGEIPENADPIPITRPADFVHPIGAKVKKLTELHLGYIEEGSATFGGSSSQTSLGAANAAGNIYTSKPTVGDLTASWGQRAASLENILAAYGIDESRVVGAGTTGDPKRAMVHPDVMVEQKDFAYLLAGPLKNGQIHYRLLLNPTPTVNINSAFGAKNNPMVVTVGCIYTHHLDWEV